MDSFGEARGGLGFVGGPGETQIEADRRAIDDAITRLRRQLSKVVKTRDLHRAARTKVPFPIVALVGYTNAGKSTLFNRLTGAEVMAKDMLFATLDPTMRAIDLPGGPRIILSDTVGFISALPTELVAAFRATLEEVLSADVILHVRDISHPETETQSDDVVEVLSRLGLDEATPIVEVWNKVDLCDHESRERLETVATRSEGVRLVSATTGEGVEGLLELVTEQLSGTVTEENLDLPFDAGRARAWLFRHGLVLDEEQTDTGFRVRVRWTSRQSAQFRSIREAP